MRSLLPMLTAIQDHLLIPDYYHQQSIIIRYVHGQELNCPQYQIMERQLLQQVIHRHWNRRW